MDRLHRLVDLCHRVEAARTNRCQDDQDYLLARVAQMYDLPICCLMHMNKDGQVLGLRSAAGSRGR